MTLRVSKVCRKKMRVQLFQRFKYMFCLSPWERQLIFNILQKVNVSVSNYSRLHSARLYIGISALLKTTQTRTIENKTRVSNLCRNSSDVLIQRTFLITAILNQKIIIENIFNSNTTMGASYALV